MDAAVALSQMMSWVKVKVSWDPIKVYCLNERNRPLANEPPLPFGQSYWDYLPDLALDKILKMTHKQLWKDVMDELWARFSCPRCSQHFDDLEEAEHHWALYSAYEER